MCSRQISNLCNIVQPVLEQLPKGVDIGSTRALHFKHALKVSISGTLITHTSHKIVCSSASQAQTTLPMSSILINFDNSPLDRYLHVHVAD